MNAGQKPKCCEMSQIDFELSPEKERPGHHRNCPEPKEGRAAWKDRRPSR